MTDQERAVQKALRTRDEFISIAAHELRTPLTTVYARLQLAERRVGRAGYDADGFRKDLAIVRKGARFEPVAYGVLRIRIPKPTATEPRRIAVGSEA